MLFIHYDKALARTLGVSREQLQRVLDRAEDCYERLQLYDPAKPDKIRNVVDVRNPLRRLQSRFYRNVLLRKLTISPYNHGGVRGRHIKTHFSPHAKSVFVFKADVSNFYPSIHHTRVYRLFLNRFKCVPDVARLCTRLCTYEHHLALGLITSPILADQVFADTDRRIGAACKKAGLVYTRFVDDLTISGPYDLQQSGIPNLIARILEEHGLAVNTQKNQFGRLADGISITGIRLSRRGRPDVKREYADEVEKQLEDARSLERGDAIERPYYTKVQIAGRIHFIRWINKQRGEELLRTYRKIRWSAVEQQARAQDLIVSQKQLTKRGQSPKPIRA